MTTRETVILVTPPEGSQSQLVYYRRELTTISCHQTDTRSDQSSSHELDAAARRLTQTGGGSHHGVQSGRHTVGAGSAPVLEDDPVVVVVRHLLHGDPDDPSSDGADRHAGDEET